MIESRANIFFATLDNRESYSSSGSVMWKNKITTYQLLGSQSSFKVSETRSRNFYSYSARVASTFSENTFITSGANFGPATTTRSRFVSQASIRSTTPNGVMFSYFSSQQAGQSEFSTSSSFSFVDAYTKQLPVTKLNTWEGYAQTYTTKTTTCEEACLTTATVGGAPAWTTITSTTSGVTTFVSGEGITTTFSEIEWDSNATELVSTPYQVGTVALEAEDSVTVHAGPAELLVYASDKQPLNGQTFSSTTYSVSYASRDYSVVDVTGFGTDIVWSTDFETISVPLDAWDSTDSTTTGELVTMVRISSSSSLNTDQSGVFSTATQTSFSEEDEYAIYQGGNAYASGKTIQEIRYKSCTVPPAEYGFKNYAYVVATTKTGWVIPDQGFHTRAPAATLATTYPLFNVGQARPGVNLYPPIGTATPIYTIAFTQSIAQSPGFSVSPNVFQISRSESTSAETSTVQVQGQAGLYGDRFSYIGGYGSDMPVTWTLVVGGPGVIVTYNTTSGTRLFTAPTSTTYSGSDGSYILYVPNLVHSAPVSAIPKYNYEEF